MAELTDEQEDLPGRSGPVPHLDQLMQRREAALQQFLLAVAELLGAVADSPATPPPVLRAADHVADAADLMRELGMFYE